MKISRVQSVSRDIMNIRGIPGRNSRIILVVTPRLGQDRPQGFALQLLDMETREIYVTGVTSSKPFFARRAGLMPAADAAARISNGLCTRRG